MKYGMKMPLGQASDQELDFSVNATPNQAMPLLLSTKGRILWNDRGYKAVFKDGYITVPDRCQLKETGGGLREAYLCAMKEYFPFAGKMPAEELFAGILYNTWIELTFYQNQKEVLAYAQNILKAGMPKGVLMIDDGWSEYYGDWSFHRGKFENPKEMIKQLHDMGFRVMVWICPFVSADSIRFREAEDMDILIKNADGETYIAKWWNGYSAALDMSNPKARVWLGEQLDALLSMGVDGFKFDAGDSLYYREDNLTFANVSRDEQSRLWAKFGESYAFNEYRATFGAGGYALLQRLCDKEHSWGANGIASLLPDLLLQGITGHPFGCPDMIGGGEYRNFLQIEDSKLDQELFVRHSEIACLMPAMQFSAAPFRILSKNNFEAILKSISLRGEYLEYIMEKVREAAKSGEPVIRYMAYEFPDQGVEQMTDQFMLGDRYLVAPIREKGKKKRRVYLPKGSWKRKGEILVSEGTYVEVSADYGEPTVYERLFY